MTKVETVLALLPLLMAAAGCVTTRDHAPITTKLNYAEHVNTVTSGIVREVPSKSTSLTGIITLEQAVKASIQNHPSLAAAQHEVWAQIGAETQAGLLSNPRIFGEIEEFGGSGGFSGTGSMQSRIGISQEIPLAGKISKRVRVAQSFTRLASKEQEKQLVDLCAEVETSFLNVYVLQERLKYAGEIYDLIEDTHNAISKRVSAGESSPLDAGKSEVELASNKLQIDRLRKDLSSAKVRLASTWGQRIPTFNGVKEQFATADLHLDLEVSEIIVRSPDYQILQQQINQAEATLGLARSEAWPDIEVGGGAQRFNESGDNAFFAELSIPLALFNRNQGSISEAQALRDKTLKKLEAGMLELQATLQETMNGLFSAQQSLQTMEQTILPAANWNYESVKKAYQAGEIDFLELVDAQRTLVESYASRLDFFAELHEQRVELERLTALSPIYQQYILNLKKSN